MESEKPKHILYTPTIAEVDRYCKMVGNEKVMVFVDNCLNDYRALAQLMKKTTIQVIGFERDNRHYHYELNQLFFYSDVFLLSVLSIYMTT